MKVCVIQQLTASRSLEQTDRHVAPARRRWVTGARSVAGAISMAVKIYVCIALCDLAAGAPAPAIQQQTKRREFRFCFNFLGINISIPREPLEMIEGLQFEECGRLKCTASIHDRTPTVVVARVRSHSHHLRVRTYLYQPYQVTTFDRLWLLRHEWFFYSTCRIDRVHGSNYRLE